MYLLTVATAVRRLSKPFPLTAVAACFLGLLSLAAHASAQTVALDIKIYDKVTGQPITTASAGTTVVLVATVVAPNAGPGVKITVNATAKLKLVGVSVPYKIPMVSAEAPNLNPQDGGVVVQTGTEQGEFKIPVSTPTGSSVKVQVQATAAGVASNTVTAKLTVR